MVEGGLKLCEAGEAQERSEVGGGVIWMMM